MGKEEFKNMLEGMVNDAEIAENISSGDFSSLQDGELTNAERALLTNAASELDGDVSGFAKFDNKWDLPTGGFVDSKGRPSAAGFLKLDGFMKATSYLKLDDFDD